MDLDLDLRILGPYGGNLRIQIGRISSRIFRLGYESAILTNPSDGFVGRQIRRADLNLDFLP